MDAVRETGTPNPSPSPPPHPPLLSPSDHRSTIVLRSLRGHLIGVLAVRETGVSRTAICVVGVVSGPCDPCLETIKGFIIDHNKRQTKPIKGSPESRQLQIRKTKVIAHIAVQKSVPRHN